MINDESNTQLQVIHLIVKEYLSYHNNLKLYLLDLRYLTLNDKLSLVKSIILSSSVVEQSAVNRLVVGSSPTWGVFIIGRIYEN